MITHMNSLSENEKIEFEKAKSFISGYVADEFNSKADFCDLQHISIGYTEIGSEGQGDFPFQVEADLINYEINYYIAGELAKAEKYDSLMEMNEQRLSCLDFEDMLYTGTTELDRILAEKEAKAPVKTVLAVSQCDTNRYFVANDITKDAVKDLIKNSDKLFMDLCALGGKELTVVEFAQYSQTDGISAIDVDIDEQTLHVYDDDSPITSFEDIRNDKFQSSDFKNLIDEFINKSTSTGIFTICKTPYSLQIVGANAENVTISAKTIQNSINPPDIKMSGHTSGHNISVDTIKQLPEYIGNPLLIANGSKSNTIVVLTEVKDNNDKNIIIPIEINKLQKGAEVNQVLSIYGKEHIKNYLNKLTGNNLILAYNKEKADELFTVTGANSPAATSIICYNNSITYTKDNVKYPLHNCEKAHNSCDLITQLDDVISICQKIEDALMTEDLDINPFNKSIER